jgi:uncharacterized membrane protein
MLDAAILWHWAEFAVRWLHVITAIAWIGSSFYFIALDLGLWRDRNLASGADGEEWQVHGGGFYHVQKYLVAPSGMPDHLTWFKWESYATWLSGAALLAIVYWAGAELYLIDPSRAHLAVWQAVAISAGSIAAGWFVYDALCRSPLGDRPTALMLVLFGVLVAMSWFYHQVFSGRAALLHLGAFTATIMSANVFAVIMPNQRVVVADLQAGRKPAAKYGKIAKLRSTHNNYLTLPVLFLMLSNHYPLATSTRFSWVIAALVFLVGVLVRHYFNTRHARAGNPHWTWAAAALVFLLIAWLSTATTWEDEGQTMTAEAWPSPRRPASRTSIPSSRGAAPCATRASPSGRASSGRPRGVVLETEADVARQARAVYLQAGASHAMPPANLSGIKPEERAAIVAWFRAAS